jgi:hypothetical protein
VSGQAQPPNVSGHPPRRRRWPIWLAAIAIVIAVLALIGNLIQKHLPTAKLVHDLTVVELRPDGSPSTFTVQLHAGDSFPVLCRLSTAGGGFIAKHTATEILTLPASDVSTSHTSGVESCEKWGPEHTADHFVMYVPTP